jgi:DNA modification methylase
VKEDDFDPDAHYETKVKAGEVWQLGEHRLMCGDSTDADAVAKLMNGERADLVFTDPPYGMKKESEGVLNDNLNFDDLLEFNKRWIPLTFANLKDNGSWYCWGIDEPLMDIYSNILRPMQKRNEITFRNLITWDKGNGQGQRSEDFRMYAIADEKCLFVMNGVQGFNINQDNYFEGWEPIRIYFEEEIKKIGQSDHTIAHAIGKADGRSVNHWYSKSQFAFITKENYEAVKAYAASIGIDIFKREFEEIKREWYSTRAYFDNTHDNMNNVWHFDRTSAEEREGLDHATPKPLALCARGIKTSSREGEIVLDVFGGSGSTMIACEQLGRKCRMMELDPHYCTVIIARWEKLTGLKAVKLNE